MRSGIRISAIIFLFFDFFLFFSCRKEEVPPTVVTSEIVSILGTTVSGGGTVTSEGSSNVISKGVCWSTTNMPTINDPKTIDGSGAGNFTSIMTGLDGATTYYVRAYATNRSATSYGKEISFRTYTGTVSDIDGNVYNTIVIGTQIWMAENLITTHFSNNTLISNIADNFEWASLSGPGFCRHINDTSVNKDNYGVLYNWYTVDEASNGGRNVCPAGWHVPTDAEWTSLTTFLGGEEVAGGKMKETGTLHWYSPNTGATNESGFTGLPGGGRYFDGTFSQIDRIGGWWSSTELLASSARGRFLYYNYSLIYRGSGSKRDGFSIRCIRD